MRPRVGALLAGLAAAGLAIGMTLRSGHSHEPSTQPSPTKSVDLRAVSDSAPYWCDYVPREALQRIAGVSTDLTEARDSWAIEQGGCRVDGPNLAYPLGVEVMRGNTHKTIDSELKKWRKFTPKRLPDELGYGFVVYAPGHVDDRPYITSSAFQCGDRQTLIYLEIVDVAKGRDYLADLTELMRIAKKRYGVLHKCMPGPVK
jgi:hypothetical protein